MSSGSPNSRTSHLTQKEQADLVETLSCVRYVGLAMFVAATVLMIFNSSGLQTWTRNLNGNAITDGWVREADNWHGAVSRLGLAAPKVVMQRAMTETRELSWRSLVGADTAHAEEVAGADDVDPSDAEMD